MKVFLVLIAAVCVIIVSVSGIPEPDNPSSPITPEQLRKFLDPTFFKNLFSKFFGGGSSTTTEEITIESDDAITPATGGAGQDAGGIVETEKPAAYASPGQAPETALEAANSIADAAKPPTDTVTSAMAGAEAAKPATDAVTSVAPGAEAAKPATDAVTSVAPGAEAAKPATDAVTSVAAGAPAAAGPEAEGAAAAAPTGQ